MAHPANYNRKSLNGKMSALMDRLYGSGDGIGAGKGPTGGTNADRIVLASGKNWIDYRTECAGTSGDSRGAYLKHYFTSTGSGEALRAYATAAAASVATGGTVNGAHITLDLAASASVSGQGNAIRATLGAAADTRTLNANLAALMLESDIATGNTVPANMAFLRVVDTGAVPIKKLLRLPTVASAGLLAAHTTDAVTHSIRCVDEAGTVFYIMCTTTASNRTGGA